MSAHGGAGQAAERARTGWAAYRPSAEQIEQDLAHFRRGASFRVAEFASLSDGRRLTLHDERGFTMGRRATGSSALLDPWEDLTQQELTRDVLTTVLPDEDDTEEEHPWQWLAELLRAHGVPASADDIRGLPYEVVFSERLQALLTV